MGFFYILDAIGESAWLDYSRSIRLDLLELFGSYYVIEHMIAEHDNRMEEKAYRVYTADVLKVLADSWGATITKRYMDMIDRTPEDTRTGDEVALEVIRKLGLKVEGGGEPNDIV